MPFYHVNDRSSLGEYFRSQWPVTILKLLTITLLMVEVLEEFVILFWMVTSVCTRVFNKGHSYWFLSCSVLFGDWKVFILCIGSYWHVLCCWHFTLNYLVCPSFFPPFLSSLPSFEIGNVTSPFLNYEMTQESRGGRECPGVGMIGQCWLFKVSS